jgi:GNAT superfamily N-acetyltransferase
MMRPGGFSLLLGTAVTAPRILELARRMRRETGTPMARAQEDALRMLMVDASLGRVWLANFRDQPAGYAAAFFRYSVEMAGRVALFGEFYITPETRGRGLGRRMLRAACSDLADFGIRHFQTAAEDGSAAASLFLSEGFCRSPLRIHEREVNEEDDFGP